jgi:hypothetical protein
VPGLIALGVFAAITPVQKAMQSGGYSIDRNEVQLSLPSPTTAGNGLVVFGFWWVVGLHPTISDSQGNTYQVTPPIEKASGVSTTAQLFYVPALKGGPLTVTLWFDACMDTVVGMAIAEYPTLGLALQLDVLSGQAAPASTADASTPVVSTNRADLLVALFEQQSATAGQIVPAAGWTTEASDAWRAVLIDQTQGSPGPFSAGARMANADAEWVALAGGFFLAPVDAGSLGPPDAGVPDAGAPPGGPRVVQRVSHFGGGTEASVTLGAEVGEGHALVILGVVWKGGLDAGLRDNAGDGFVSLPAVYSPALRGMAQLFFAEGLHAGSRTVTFFVDTPASALGLGVLEYEGLREGGAFDDFSAQGAPGDGGRIAWAPEVSVSEPGELVISGFLNPSGSGIISPLGGARREACSSAFYWLLQDQILPEPGSFVASAQMPRADDGWVATAVSFRAAPSPDAGLQRPSPAPLQGAIGCGCGQGLQAMGGLLLVASLLRAHRRRICEAVTQSTAIHGERG